MARTRTGQELINDAYIRSDLEGAESRHPRTEVLRHVNQGCAALYDLLIEARGPLYYRAQDDFVTVADDTVYPLEDDFYRLLSVRIQGSPDALRPFTVPDEPGLRYASSLGDPLFYQLRPGEIELLPAHAAGKTIVLDYIPVCPDLADSSGSTFDGINGWEEYVVAFAAKCMATKDENWELVAECRKDMAAIAVRVSKLAPTRDTHRAERVRNVRNVLGRWRRFG